MDPLPFAHQVQLQRLGQQPTVRLRHVASCNVIVTDVDPIEDTLVQVAPARLRRVHVVALGVGEQRAKVVQLLDHLVAVSRVLRDHGLRISPCCGNTSLLLFHLLKRDRIGIVSGHEPIDLLLQVSQSLPRFVLGRVLGRQQGVDVIEHQAAHFGNLRFGQGHDRPVLLNEFFDQVGLGCLEGAAVLETLPAEAVEVVVEVAQPVPGLLERQRLTALAAVNGALEVVGVDAWLLTALSACGADLLGASKQLLADEGWVLARILNAFELDDSDVVPVFEYRVDV